MNKRAGICIAAAIIVGSVILATWKTSSNARTPNNVAELKLSTKNADHTLGEAIDLNFVVANHTAKTLELAAPNVRTGTLKVFISADGVSYREYSGPGWAKTNDGRRTIKVESGRSLSHDSTLLFNKRRPSTHLTALYADRIQRESIETCFAIDQAGQYWIKAFYADSNLKLESEPISINILPATPLDQAVWEKVRSNDAIAYFLHTGEISSVYDAETTNRFLDDLRQLSAEHQSSHFARTIDQHLVKREQIIESLRVIGETDR